MDIPPVLDVIDRVLRARSYAQPHPHWIGVPFELYTDIVSYAATPVLVPKNEIGGTLSYRDIIIGAHAIERGQLLWDGELLQMSRLAFE